MTRLTGPALALLLLLTVSLFTQETSALACCRKYSKGVLDFSHIRGYSIQTVKTVCKIDAIIFHTKTGRNVCANPAQTWVMQSIQMLREKVKTMMKKNTKQ
ncbi:C-C motif chemokine 20a.3 [Astyanax mexicanus]|uniref:C-C motif chemokine n=1 Tax=Astyanax mexicanus TaxID=7994 RepID=A0A8B9GU59_ASTMX|nr:C-C motif chemokine 20a.3 [Astyanax mexicanus]KAG9278192.1 C-C motif chemokine 20-like [Astyanax mexicanus]